MTRQESPQDAFPNPLQENPKARVLVVDDEIELTSALVEMLNQHGYEAQGRNTAQQALELLKEKPHDLLLADLMMPEMNGITLLKKALEIDPHLIGIIMTGQGTVQTAVESMKTGAFDYILKPFKMNSVLTALSRAMEVHRLRIENVHLNEIVNIYELGQVVSVTLDLEKILRRATDAVLYQCQADEVSILLPANQKGNRKHDLIIASASGGGREKMIGQRVPRVGTIAGWVAENLEPLTLHGKINDPRFAPARPRPEIRTALSIPMLMGSHLVGVLNVNLIRHEQPLSEAQVKGLKILSGMAASAIENARLFNAAQEEIESRKQRERELESLASVSAALRSLTSRSEMLPVILQEVGKSLNTSGAAIVMRKTEGEEVVIEAANGIWKKRLGERSTRTEGIIGQAIGTKQTYVSTEEPAVLSGRPSRQKEDKRIIACTPLVAQEDVIGALMITRTDPFSDSDLKLLTAIGDIAASSLQRSGLFEQTQERLQRLTALRTIDLAISSSLDLRVTLNILLEQVAGQLGADVAAVLLSDLHSQILEFASGRGFLTKSVEDVHLSPGTGFAGTAVLERKTTSITGPQDAAVDSLAKLLFTEEGIEFCSATPLVSKGEVEGVLIVGKRSAFSPDDEWIEYLEALAGQAAIALDSARLFDHLSRANQQLTLAYNATIEGWSRALDLRDKETEGHTQRVTEMTLRLARSMGMFDEEDLVHIRRGALLHDIGKMAVPDHIMFKPGSLNDDEWGLMRQHPEQAYHLLYPIPYLRKALDIPYAHHERWDGTGYPRGLSGEQIPLAARVFAVVDVWDALSSDRPYRQHWEEERVISYLQENSGTYFDPQVVSVFTRLLRGS